MFACQLEAGKRVVKLGRPPGCAAVAALALRWEIGRNVIRVTRLFEILDVTIAAGIWGPGKSAARMARRATRVLVRAHKRKFGCSVVIETCTFPGKVRVTRSAVGRESCRHVIRVLGRTEVLGMTIKATGGGTTELPTNVARSATERRMCSS